VGRRFWALVVYVSPGLFGTQELDRGEEEVGGFRTPSLVFVGVFFLFVFFGLLRPGFWLRLFGFALVTGGMVLPFF